MRSPARRAAALALTGAALVIGGALAARWAAADGAKAAPPTPVSRAIGAAPAAAAGARLRVLGTVQDGGLPHAACTCERCEAARRDPARRRLVASVAAILPDGRVFLVDATPDLREQLDRLRDVRPPLGRVDRAPVDGVLLTHAHVGHYLGLAFFGFEAVHTRGLPLWATPRFADYLRRNGPWSQLVRLGNVELREVEPGATVELGAGVAATALAVPHRDEYADTVGWLLRGPRRRILYVPDTDAWDRWPQPIADWVREADVAILDGTFYSTGELPGRDVASIGHPLIATSVDLLAPLVRDGTRRVYFTHLNHSNPALDPASPERAALERRGFHVLEEGQEFDL